MTINELFPKFNVPVRYSDLKNISGCYLLDKDLILLNNNLVKYSEIVLLHELIHSTMGNNRLLRLERLTNNFGPYIEGSLSYRVEECIAEIGSMVASIKLGLLNEYSINIFLQALEKYYTRDIYIPVREIRAALNYYAEETTSFEDEIKEAMEYLECYMDINFQSSYTKKEIA